MKKKDTEPCIKRSKSDFDAA